MLLLWVMSPWGACFRLEVVWVGVLARKVGVFDRAVGVRVFEPLPFACDRWSPEGELDRDEGGLDEFVGLVNFLTERGSLELEDEAEMGWVGVDVAGFRVAGVRVIGADNLVTAMSLRDRECPLRLGSR